MMTIFDKTADESDIDKIFGAKFILMINMFLCVIKVEVKWILLLIMGDEIFS